MTRHLLPNRQEKGEIFFSSKRRDTLETAAAWLAMGEPPATVA